MTRTAYHPSHVQKGLGALQSCTSAIFAYGGKVMGGNFAEAPDGGVFGPEALRRVWYVTEAANLLRILARTT